MRFLSLLAASGLILSLFLPRRRVWVKAVASGTGSAVEVAGLARGNDAGLAEEVDGVLARLREVLGEPEHSPADPVVGDHEQPAHVPEESP